MSSEFIICETEHCTKNADLIAVYGCLNQHVSDVIICEDHFKAWLKSLQSSICGSCGTHIDVPSVKIKMTSTIKMNRAAGILNRPKQQTKIWGRMNKIGWTPPNIPTYPYNTKPFPYTNFKKEPEEIKLGKLPTMDGKGITWLKEKLEEKQMITCHHEEKTCRRPADQVIIYGCFQQHIRELALCTPHTIQWIKNFKEHIWRCSACSKIIQEYGLLDVDKVRIYSGG